VKTFHIPESCEVMLEPDEFGGTQVSAVRFRKAMWRTGRTLETWVYWGEWWLDSALEGETRTYFVLATNRGEITVFYCQSPRASKGGWFIAGWYD
jgi:hypothetical protein